MFLNKLLTNEIENIKQDKTEEVKKHKILLEEKEKANVLKQIAVNITLLYHNNLISLMYVQKNFFQRLYTQEKERVIENTKSVIQFTDKKTELENKINMEIADR